MGSAPLTMAPFRRRTPAAVRRQLLRLVGRSAVGDVPVRSNQHQRGPVIEPVDGMRLQG